jgi:hypothetical protein
MKPLQLFTTVAWAASAGLALTGCASMSNELSSDLALAETTIHEAEQAGAQQLSPKELTRAREKLETAQRLVDDNEFDEAQWRAEESIVTAQLALAKSHRADTEQAAGEISASLEDLRSEAVESEQDEGSGS